MIKFLLKNLFIHFLALILIDLPSPTVMPFLGGVVFAAEESTGNAELDQNIEAYGLIVSHSNYPAVLDSDGAKAAMDKVQKFVSNSANRSALASGEGRNLLNLHNRFVKYMKLKKKFDNCIAEGDREHASGLPERLLAGAINAEGMNYECDRGIFEAESLEALFADVSDVVRLEDEKRAENFHNFQGKMHLEGMKNAARTYFNMEYTYNKSLGGDSETLPQSDIDNLLEKMCEREFQIQHGPGSGSSVSRKVDRCTDEEKETMAEAFKFEYAKVRRNNSPRYTLEEARENVVGRIRRINEVIDQNTFDVETHLVASNTIDYETDKSRESHNNYVSAYMAEASSGPGLLLWTDEMGMRRQDKHEQRFLGLMAGGFNPDTNRYRHHSTEIGEESIRRSIEEAKNKIMGQTNYLKSKESSRHHDWRRNVTTPLRNAEEGNYYWSKPTADYSEVIENRRDTLKDMVRKNPVIAGQALMQNPEYVSEACDAINGVIQEVKDGKEFGWDDVFFYGAIAVGGALLLATGVGALMMVAGGAAVAATGSSILVGATYVGLGLGVAEMSFYGPRMAAASRDKNEFISSFLAGGGDEFTADEYLDKLNEFEDARINFLMAAGFTVFDLGAMRSIMRGMSSADKLQMLTNANDFMSYVARNRRLGRQISRTTREIGRMKMGRVLRMMSRQDNYKEILDYIKTLSPAKAKEVFENGFKVCDELCQ